MAKMGRPRIEIKWEEVNKLLIIQCTDVEICGFLDISRSTLLRCCKRDKKMTFEAYSELKRGLGKISLRRELWQRATNVKLNNTAALIFACKTMAGLREHDERPKVESTVDGKAKIVIRWDDEQS